MKILYYGTVCDENLYNKILKIDSNPYMVAQYSFETAFLSEVFRSKIYVDCQYIPQCSRFPIFEKLFFLRETKNSVSNITIKYIPSINLPILRLISIFVSTLFISMKWVLKNRKDENCIFLSSINYLPVSLANHIVAKVFSVKNVCFFTDTTEFGNLPERVKSYKSLKRFLWPFYRKIVHWTENEYKGYVLFSKYMNEIVNLKKRSFIVVEGIFNDDNLTYLDVIDRKKSILFAGSLFKQYGVLEIIEAFNLMPKCDYELWIAGSGELNNEIIASAKLNEKIKYFGFLSRNEVFQLEQTSTLLINIRDAKDKFTRYSFPSKLLEYLVSGTPILTSKLSGIPTEYNDYMFFTESNNPLEIKNDIMKILNLSKTEHDEIGTAGKQFILNRKNAVNQTKIILKYLEEL